MRNNVSFRIYCGPEERVLLTQSCLQALHADDLYYCNIVSLIFQSKLHPSSPSMQEMSCLCAKRAILIPVIETDILSALCLDPTLWPLVGQ